MTFKTYLCCLNWPLATQVDIELGLSQLSDLKVVDDPGTHVCVCAQAIAMCTLSGATRAVAMCTL